MNLSGFLIDHGLKVFRAYGNLLTRNQNHLGIQAWESCCLGLAVDSIQKDPLRVECPEGLEFVLPLPKQPLQTCPVFEQLRMLCLKRLQCLCSLANS